ncbi:MAG TPA: glucose-6-phosphate dehydrogenase [Patescibacteria group bacterium]|jgi:glucose-6-phosphate 1-dehydrogenase|nr:glucose-6-phosphate dehydrogenase [Patescibacteria group bacterium]
MEPAQRTPTILTILGITGDLAAIKTLPALFNLAKSGELPSNFKIVGFGRKPFTNETFPTYVVERLQKRMPLETAEALFEFASKIDYVQGNFDDVNSYNNLALHLHKIEHAWEQLSHFIFYLAVPPEIYQPIIRNIRATPLYRDNDPEVQTRVIVEKPIGKDSASATVLENLLTESFKSEEIYRIDHYLAKEMIQNILTFRFGNDLFEPNWNAQGIEKIEMKLWENFGVEKRGNFYDGLGALRDVGQNHLLQMLALLTMEVPEEFSALSLHAKRAEVLNKLRPLTGEEMTTQTFRAQYVGYQDIEGVTPGSGTETYFKIKAYIDDERWDGVPIIVEAGKRLHEQRKEIIVTYKHRDPCWCRDKTNHDRNTITFELEPTEGIIIKFWSKKPGYLPVREQRTIDFMLRSGADIPQYTEEYQKLLLDAILGDQTLFVSTAEIHAMWRFVDPIIEAWERGDVPLHSYVPDTDEAVEQSKNKI